MLPLLLWLLISALDVNYRGVCIRVEQTWGKRQGGGAYHFTDRTRYHFTGGLPTIQPALNRCCTPGNS